MMELAGLETSMHPTGSVDSETADFNIIRKKLMDGEISPAEAINQGRVLIAGRQDYH